MIQNNPTYYNYTYALSRTMSNKALFNKYNFQSMTGLKSASYSGYGTEAGKMLNFESAIKTNANFVENNKKLETNFKALSTSLESINKFISSVKSQLTSLSGTDLNKINPDYTGGEITFTDNTPANYVGKTLTINGTQYTFDNNNLGNNIDISTATNANDVITALQNKLPANTDFTFDNGTFSFPLYTVDGESSLLSTTSVTLGKPHIMSNEQSLAIKELQNMAFASMQNLVDSMNINIDGNYLLSGGVSNKAPVKFPFKTLEEFQSYFDGINVSYPTSASANLSNLSFDSSMTGNISLELDAGNVNTGTITSANPNGFTKEMVSANPASTGNLTFDTTKNTIKADKDLAFSSLKAGDTLVISGGNSGGNDKAYVIKSVSDDGKTIFLDQSTPVVADATISPNDDVKFGTSYPIGSVINTENFGNGIAKNMEVTGISDDGKTLLVKVDPNRFPANGSPVVLTPADNWSMKTESYYNGGNLSSEQRISDNQSITFDITAVDPAFEKLFRALGNVCQGNFVDTRNPADGLSSPIDYGRTDKIVENAINLLNDSVKTASPNHNQKNTDFQTVLSKISINNFAVKSAIDTQELVGVHFEEGLYNIKNVDPEEAAAKSLAALNTLNASYAILNNIMGVSFLNYMK